MAKMTVVPKTEVGGGVASIPEELIDLCGQLLAQIGNEAGQVDLDEGDDPKQIRKALLVAADRAGTPVVVQKQRGTDNVLFVTTLTPEEVEARKATQAEAAKKRAKTRKANAKAAE